MVNSKPLVLIHQSIPPFDVDETFDIMLSPQFYILKREQIPVRFRYQANRLAPSILESLLSDEGRYEYYVFRDGESWAFVAYDAEALSHFLQSRGASLEKISRLYFAQQAAEKFMVPVCLDDTEVLGNIQNIVTVVPKSFLPNATEYQEFSNEFRPKKGKAFGAASHSIVSEKNAWVIAAIFLLFAMMFTVEGLRYQRVIASTQSNVSALLSRHPALQSRYARENIAKKYQRIDREERHKREILKNLSRLILPGVELEKLLLEGDRFSATMKCPDEKTVVRVQSLAREKRFRVSRVGDQHLVKIEGSL